MDGQQTYMVNAQEALKEQMDKYNENCQNATFCQCNAAAMHQRRKGRIIHRAGVADTTWDTMNNCHKKLANMHKMTTPKKR